MSTKNIENLQFDQIVIERTSKKYNANSNKAELCFDIVNIIAEYSSVQDYAKFIQYNPKLYSWNKYFNNNLPNIYDAINLYDCIDLINYKISNNPKINLDYNEVEFKSVATAKHIIKIYPLSNDEDSEDYESLISSAIVRNNLELLTYLLPLKIYDLVDYYYDFFETALRQKANLETIKILLDYAKRHNSNSYEEIEGEFIDLAYFMGSKEVKKYVKTLESYD